MIHLLSFATTNMSSSLSRIGKEAVDSGFFDKIWLYNEKKIKSFVKERKPYFTEYKRGYGYWLWKPYLILYTLLEKMNEGDILVYLDAGCEIHQTGQNRWTDYLEMLKKHSMLVYDHLHSFENQSTKYDVLKFFNVLDNSSVLDSKQLWAGGLMMRKDSFTSSLIKEWFTICDTNRTTLLCDLPSSEDELPTFKQHCHDQSIFSVLCKIKDIGATDSCIDSGRIKVLDMTENYPYPCDWGKMGKYPFWAKRNKEFSSPSMFMRIKAKVRRVINKILDK